jgi:tetratricopeptide (TPR) repeat protein
MLEQSYLVEDKIKLSESVIWDLNKNYYKQQGTKAWSEGEVPHYITSNSTVGKTYAELIFGFLCDLEANGKTAETVYILELGAGHGRLCFHILTHLNKRIKGHHKLLPAYVYVLSDIIEGNLDFFKGHVQLQSFFENRTLDVTYFDCTESDQLFLHFQNKKISKGDLSQPMVAIGNYIFDSIPFDLIRIKDKNVASAFTKVSSPHKNVHHHNIPNEDFEIEYFFEKMDEPYDDNPIYNSIIKEYLSSFDSTFLHFPRVALDCLMRLKMLSSGGILLLTMDKGIQHLALLDKKPKPEWITHGSISFTVNFHAFIRYFELVGGGAMFSKYANFHLEIGCLCDALDQEFPILKEAFRLHVDEFGPDDHYTLVNIAYKQSEQLTVEEIITVLRAANYDSTVFEKLVVYIKKQMGSVALMERERLRQTFRNVLEMYFNIGVFDLAFEMGGLLYDLGYFPDAIDFFKNSENMYGKTEDSYFNIAIATYQLKQDDRCRAIIKECNQHFPSFAKINELLPLLDIE